MFRLKKIMKGSMYNEEKTHFDSSLYNVAGGPLDVCGLHCGT